MCADCVRLRPQSGPILNPITRRRDALREKVSRYFTGKPCKHGHICERYARSGECINCWINRDSVRRQAVGRDGAKRGDIVVSTCVGCEHPELYPLLTFPRKRTGQMICCPRCGIEKYFTISKILRNGKFCSKKCYNEYIREERNLPKCRVCGGDHDRNFNYNKKNKKVAA